MEACASVQFLAGQVWCGAVDGGRNCPSKEMNRIFEAWKPAEKQWEDSVRTVCPSPSLQGKDNQKVPAAEKGRRTFQTVVSGGRSGLPSALCLAQPPGSLQTLRRVSSPFLPQRCGIWGQQRHLGAGPWEGMRTGKGQVGSPRRPAVEGSPRERPPDRPMGETGHAPHRPRVSIPTVSCCFQPVAQMSTKVLSN